MKPKSRVNQLIGPLVLAFLMVFTVLDTLAPRSAAQAITAPGGEISITVGPDFGVPNYATMGTTGSPYYPWHWLPPSGACPAAWPNAAPPTGNPNCVEIPKYPVNPATVYATPSAVGAQRTVRVAFGQISATQVDFVYWLRPTYLQQPATGSLVATCDPKAAPPPSGTSTPNVGFAKAMDPCLTKAIKWRPDLSYSTRPGWTASANAENFVKKSRLSGADVPPARILTFTNPTGQPVSSAITGTTVKNVADFVLGFDVEGSPNGDSGLVQGTPPDEFHVQINVIGGGLANGVPFETTCKANTDVTDSAPSPGPNPQSALTCVFSDPPFDDPVVPPANPPSFRADPPTGVCSAPSIANCNGSPGLVIRIDDTRPSIFPTDDPKSPSSQTSVLWGAGIACICSFVSEDVDHNGHIDRFVASFTEPLDATTFDYHAFTIQTKGRDRPYTITNAFFMHQATANDANFCIVGRTDLLDAPLPPALPAPTGAPSATVTHPVQGAAGGPTPQLVTSPGSTCRVVFIVAEMPFWDTGDLPNLQYNGCCVTDRAGNMLRKISGSQVQAVDRAAPVMTSVLSANKASEMDVFFSENVLGSGDGQAACAANPTPPTGTEPCDGEGVFPGQVVEEDLCYHDNGLGVSGNVVGSGVPAFGNCGRLNTPYNSADPLCTPIPAWPKEAPCRYFETVYHTPVLTQAKTGTKQCSTSGACGWAMVVRTQPNPLNGNQRWQFGDADVQPITGDQLGVDTSPTAPGSPNTRRSRTCQGIGTVPNFDVQPCDANIRDLADNGLFYPTGPATAEYSDPPAIRHITFPLVKSGRVDVSHDLVTLTFNGPVRGVLGGCDTVVVTGKTVKAPASCNFDVQTAAGPGQGPTGIRGPPAPGKISSSSGPQLCTPDTPSSQELCWDQPDSDTIILQLDHPVRPVDVSLNPSRIKMHCQPDTTSPIGGLGTTVIGMPPPRSTFTATSASLYVPCQDPDMFYGPGADENGVVLTPDIDLIDLTPPTIVKGATVDADHDGYLDGVELTFSEPIDDASFCGGDLALSAPTYCPDSSTSGFVTFSRWTPPCTQAQFAKLKLKRTDFRDFCPHSPVQTQRFESQDGKSEECRGSFRWDTGTVENDNRGIISHVTTTFDNATSGWITRVADCTEYWLGKDTGLKWTTDELLHLTTPVPGLFWDLASRPYHDNTDRTPPGTQMLPNPNLMPTMCQFESVSVTGAGLNLPDVANHPDLSCSTAPKAIYTLEPCVGSRSNCLEDGAPPVVWRAQTYDEPYYDRKGIHSAKVDKNTEPAQYGDGTIDGYRLTFSEPVNDGSFDRRDFLIEGYAEFIGPTGKLSPHNVTKMVSFGTNASIEAALPVAHASASNDDQIIVMFNPMVEVITHPNGLRTVQKVPDTGTKPELTSKGGSITDLKGNHMLAFNVDEVQEEDGAAPMIVRVEGFANTDSLLLHFSEPVDNGAHSGLVRDDFQYFDLNVKLASCPEAPAGAPALLVSDCNGIKGMAGSKAENFSFEGQNLQPVLHKAGDSDATIPFGSNFSGGSKGDIATDKIGARSCRIYETAPSQLPALRQCVPNIPRPLAPQNDTTPPAQIGDLRVIEERTTADGIVLGWTAPADDAAIAASGSVSSYTCFVKEGQDSVTEALKNPDSTVFTYDPPLTAPAPPGHTQTVLVTGLKPLTQYHFACIALDSDDNPSALSSDVTETTTHDVTPPTGELIITSATHPEGIPTENRTAVFTWTKLKDPESRDIVTYHWRLNENEDYVVLATDNGESDSLSGAGIDNEADVTVPGEGDWYFHVAGFTGGGVSLTKTYHIVIGENILDATEIQDINDRINVTAVRQESVLDDQAVIVNSISWELPPSSDLPGIIQGVEVWRDDDGVFTKLQSQAEGACRSMEGSYDELASGSCIDRTAGANVDSKYRVNMVFEQDQRQGDPVKGYTSVVDQTPSAIPPWVWILAGVALALIIAGIVIFVVLRKRQKQESTGSVAYSWESANPELLGIDEATGLPVHEVRCPSCNNPFQAVGALPLPVTCPTCGTTGQLD